MRATDGTPSLVNVWVSLTRASSRNACMHVVPFERDAGWPRDLHQRPPLETGCALPTDIGEVLAWNANVFHWGGTCDPTFDEPRISISFSLCRPGWSIDVLPRIPARTTFRQRLDLIANQLIAYGENELDVRAPILEWASATETMRRLARTK
jgi:hypothetical protein